MILISSGVSLSTPASQKKSYGRPKSAEPGSPLLRRALSPDRLHPRSAENKTSISPLANSVVRVTPRATIAQQSHPETHDENGAESIIKGTNDLKNEKKSVIEQKSSDYSKLPHGISISIPGVGLSNSCGSTQLPRIAEEKDSPTGTKGDEYTTKEITSSEKDLTSKIHELSTNKDEEKNRTITEKTVIPSVDRPSKSTAPESRFKSFGNRNDGEALPTKVLEFKVFNKNKMETSPEIRKILKRYKSDGNSFESTSGTIGKLERSSSVDDKKNK